jgi:hypothetical protein
VGAGFLAIYLAWAPRAAGGGDSSEFVVVLGTLGLAHPTGYPVYTLLGHIFVRTLHLAGADWAWAANAWSALGGAAALGLLHALGGRLLTRDGLRAGPATAVALLPAVAVGLNPVWTAEATVAEVNSWHLAWVAGACLFAVATIEAVPARRDESGWTSRRVAAWSLLVALGVVHHATSLIFSVPLTLALLAVSRPWRIAWLVPACAGLAVLMIGWGYVLFRSLHPASVQWGSLGPGALETWNHVTAAGYRHYLGSFAPAPEQRAALQSYVAPWLVPGLLAAILWLAAPSRVPRATRRALAAAVLLQATYPLLYGVSDPLPYFIPALALAVFVLPAVAAPRRAVRRLARPLTVAAAIALLAGAWFWSEVALERRRTLAGVDGFLRTMWRAVPIQRGFVLWDDDMAYRLLQYQRLDGEKPGLVVVRPRLLMDAGTRGLWERRHGFDPLAGANPPADEVADRPEQIEAFARAIGEGINRSSPDSVILFLPREPALRLLPKPSPP